jgi:hypothetical protein
MLDFMKKSTNSDLLPTNIVAGDGGIGMINSYNNWFWIERSIEISYSNPSVIKMDQQICL